MKIILTVICLFAYIINAYPQTTLERIEKLYDREIIIPEIEQFKESEHPFKNLYIAVLYHNMAARGDFEFTTDAIEYCEKAFSDTALPLALSYHGSALTIEAAAAAKEYRLIEAYKKVKEGNRLIDLAVSIDPGNLDTRLLRFFHAVAYSEKAPQPRMDIAQEDRAFIADYFEDLDRDVKSAVLHFSARMDILNGDMESARNNFIKSILLAPDSLSARISRIRMKKHFPDSPFRN